MNSLSENFNRLRVDCYIGDNKLNHVFFADGIFLLAHSLNGLQDLVDMLQLMLKRIRFFLTTISQLVYFSNPNSFVFQLLPFFLIQILYPFSDNVKYLEIKLNALLSDDDDICRQIRTIYCTANNLKISFSQSSTSVNNVVPFLLFAVLF